MRNLIVAALMCAALNASGVRAHDVGHCDSQLDEIVKTTAAYHDYSRSTLRHLERNLKQSEDSTISHASRFESLRNSIEHLVLRGDKANDLIDLWSFYARCLLSADTT